MIVLRTTSAAQIACLILSLSPALGQAQAAPQDCPTSTVIDAQLEKLGPLLEQASRSRRFDFPVPQALYERAAVAIGKPQAARDGDVGIGVLFVDLPVEDLWRAVNDEDHHALEGYLPVRHSEVIGGQPRGQSRLLFQWFQQVGVGRWWVSRIEMNPDLFEASDRRLWEIHWEDQIADAPVDRPPIQEIADRMEPLQASHGSWLLTSFGPRCTAIEYFTRSRPGGVVKLGQLLFAKKAVRDALDGLERLAREHLETHPELDFIRPDGTPLPPYRGSLEPTDEPTADELRNDLARTGLEAEGNVLTPSQIANSLREVASNPQERIARFDRFAFESSFEILGTELILDGAHPAVRQTDRHQTDFTLPGQRLYECVGVPKAAEDQLFGLLRAEDPSSPVGGAQDDTSAGHVEFRSAHSRCVVRKSPDLLTPALANEYRGGVLRCEVERLPAMPHRDDLARANVEKSRDQRGRSKDIDDDDRSGRSARARKQRTNDDTRLCPGHCQSLGPGFRRGFGSDGVEPAQAAEAGCCRHAAAFGESRWESTHSVSQQ